MKRTFWQTGLLAAALGFTVAGEASAQTTAVVSGDWSNAATWDAGVPDGFTEAFINGGQTVTISGSGAITSLLDIGTEADASGTLAITGGDLTVSDDDTVDEPNFPSIRLGQAAGSTGTLTMSAGNVFILGPTESGFAVGDLLVGDNGNATMTMTGGDFVAADEIVVATQASSTATLTVNGGTLSTAGRSVLVGFGGNGTLNVGGTGSVTANYDLLVGFLPGSTATINQTGGTITAGLLFTNFEFGAPNTVTMNQSGGEFNARIAFVLGRGVGTTTFTHSGGTVNAMQGNGDFVVSDGGGNTSTYNISGTAVTNALTNVTVGQFEGANGTINQTGGTLTAGNNLRVGGDGVGAWNMSAGTTSARNVFLGDFDSSFGTMTVSGGTLNLSGDLNVGGALASNAAPDRLEPNEANGAQGQAVDANGTFIIQGTGGDINVAGNLLANPADKSAFRNGPGQENDSILNFTLGTAGISTISVGGIADMDGAVIDIDDSIGYFTTNPAASLTLIDAAGGFDNVHLITVAEQAGDGRGFTLAAGDSSLYSLAIQPSGVGEKLVLTRTTGGGLAADFNDDGLVNSQDFTIWKGAFGMGTAGDANGDLRTDGADFLIWQRQFGTAGATPAVGAVPEPAGAAMVGLALAALAAWRRRS